MRSRMRIVGIAIMIVFALIGVLFTSVFLGMHLGIFNVRGASAGRDVSIAAVAAVEIPAPLHPCTDPLSRRCAWSQTPEWAAIAGGLLKDKDAIDRVAAQTGVPSRLIAAVVVPEQMRFFTSEREVFKRVFEPLKILGSLSQFSLGVSGIKQETARQIEEHAQDASSPFFVLGDAALIAYASSTTAHDAALYDRLTDEHDHYYSYLYTALYIRQIERQWQAAGFGAALSPGVIATLFNIGFAHSQPHASPEVGGSIIEAGGQQPYTFGELAAAFYASDELVAAFPLH